MKCCDCFCKEPPFEAKVIYHNSNEKLEVIDIAKMKREENTVSEKTVKKLKTKSVSTLDPFLNHGTEQVKPADKLTVKKQVRKSLPSSKVDVQKSADSKPDLGEDTPAIQEIRNETENIKYITELLKQSNK